MIGLKDHYKLYDDNTFNCPYCFYVHFEKDWRPKWKADGEKFQIECLNKDCRRELIAFIEQGIVHVTTLKVERFVFRKKNKIKKMKRIDVQSHVNRYVDVHINDKVKLIEALQLSVDNDRENLLIKRNEEIEKLKQGIIPEDEPAKPKRQRKKKDEQPNENQDANTVDNGPFDDL